MNEKELLGQLKTRLQEVDDLYKAGAVLGWDQSTYMPPGGSVARGRQLATLGRVAHERATDPEIGRLLDALQPWAEKLSPDNDDGAIIRIARRAYDRNVKVPVALVGELNSHLAVTYDAWAKARPANDFGMVREGLEKTVDLSRKLAECLL